MHTLPKDVIRITLPLGSPTVQFAPSTAMSATLVGRWRRLAPVEIPFGAAVRHALNQSVRRVARTKDGRQPIPD